jgi:hypothetical protein
VASATSLHFEIKSTHVDLSIVSDRDGRNAVATTNLPGHESSLGTVVLEENYEGREGAVRGVFTRDADGLEFSFVLASDSRRPLQSPLALEKT